MYARGTVLTRREPFEVPDAKADPPVQGDPRHIYNRVRVIGPSPIAHVGGVQNWEGVDSRGVIVEPLNGFGGTVDRPIGELNQEYTIESEPDATIVQPSIRVINAHTREAGPTPEDVFRELPQGKPAAKRRARGGRS